MSKQIYVLIDDKKRGDGAKTFYDMDFVQFAEYNNRGWGVFRAVNEFDVADIGDEKTPRQDKFCTKLRYVYADIDIAKAKDGTTTGEKQARKNKVRDALTAVCEPTIIVDTANGLQPYWKLEDAEVTELKKDQYRNVIKGIIEWSKGYGSMADDVFDVSRILRMPGYNHHKEDPYMVAEIHRSEKVYTLDQLSAVFPYEEKKQPVTMQVNRAEADNPVFRAIDELDIKDVVSRAQSSIGRPVTWDSDGRMIDPIGGTTGTFIGRKGNKNYLASTSHEPFRGNHITAVSQILKISYGDAYRWICEEYVLEYKKLKKAEKNTVVSVDEDVEFVTLTNVVKSAVEELAKTVPSSIVSFGYDWLDQQLTGIFPGELVVIGGETGTGKTTFATSIIYKASKKHKCTVYALEDRLVDYGIKALFFKINELKKGEKYPWNDYRRAEIRDKYYPMYVEKAQAALENENVTFARVKKMMSIDLLEQTIEKQTAEGVKLFLIDHLHYFNLTSSDKSKVDYIEEVMVRLKTVQNKTGARVLLVVHYAKLNGQKPRIDSFKDSVAISQNANYIINLWRDREELGTANAKIVPTKFFIPKSRNPNGEARIDVDFDTETNSYVAKGGWLAGTPTYDRKLVDKVHNLLNF